MGWCTLTVVIPVYDEEEVIAELLSRLRDVFDKLEDADVSVTGLFVDDGSQDATLEEIRSMRQADGRFGYVQLSRNFGHQAAIAAGLDYADTDCVVVMDGDLQDPPELIIDLVDMWRRGDGEVIYCQRRSREGSRVKRFCYRVFYWLFNLLVDRPIPPESGDFALMDRKVYEALRAFPERVRFLRGLRSWIGFRQVPLYYHRPERPRGQPKYSFGSLYKLATDALASFSVAPLRVAQFLSFFWAFLTGGVLLWALLNKSVKEFDIAFLMIVFLGLSMAMLFMCLYIVGAYLARTYLESKRRPIYILAEVVRGKGKSQG